MSKLVARKDGRVQVAGRRTKCTPELIDVFKKTIEEVYYITTACDKLHIHNVTATRWLASGNEHEKQFHPDLEDCNESCPEDKVAFRLFMIALKEGQANFNEKRLKSIQKHEAKSFLPSAWLLERTQPDKFGLKTRTEHKVSGEVKSTINITVEQRQRALRAAQESLKIDTNENLILDTAQDENGVYSPVQNED